MDELDDYDVFVSDRGCVILLPLRSKPQGATPSLVLAGGDGYLHRDDKDVLVLKAFPEEATEACHRALPVIAAEVDEIEARQRIANGEDSTLAIEREYRLDVIVNPKSDVLADVRFADRR